MPSKRLLPVEGTQRMPAKAVSKRPGPPVKSGDPVSTKVPASPPKAPGPDCPGQKRPSGAETVAVPLPRPEKLIACRPMYPCGAGGHSTVVFFEPTPPEHGSPARAPEVHTPSTHWGHAGAWASRFT